MTLKPVEPADFDRSRAADLHQTATSQALPMTATPAPEHVQRVHTERRELFEKLEKLEAFIAGPAIGELDKVDAMLLELQASAMRQYLEILVRRLNRFGVA